uniref:Uncharacterized protein n=1 Tax=Ditylenchus dipsaci TaxID=166011 RepID=A0A915DAI0_9BILA
MRETRLRIENYITALVVFLLLAGYWIRGIIQMKKHLSFLAMVDRCCHLFHPVLAAMLRKPQNSDVPNCPKSSYMPFSGALADALIDAGHTVSSGQGNYGIQPQCTLQRLIQNQKCASNQTAQSSGLMQSKHITAPFQHFHLPRWNPHIEQSKYKLCEALVTNQSLLNQLLAEHYDIYVTSVYDGCTSGCSSCCKSPAWSATQSQPPQVAF